jgi:hypothetical protein
MYVEDKSKKIIQFGKKSDKSRTIDSPKKQALVRFFGKYMAHKSAYGFI